MPLWLIQLVTSKAFWIVVGLVLIAAGGWYAKGVYDDRARLEREVDQLKETAKATKDLQRGANQAEANLLDRLRADKEESDERSKRLQAELDKSKGALRACRIDADTLRVLNDEQRAGIAGSAAGAQPDAPAVEAGAGSTCEALALTFNENHGRFQQLRDQVIAWQQFYADLRARYCNATGVC